MRYLFGFLCVCALGVISLIGCCTDAGDGGNGGRRHRLWRHWGQRGLGRQRGLVCPANNNGGLQITPWVAVLILRLSLAAYQGNSTVISNGPISTPIVLQGAWWRCQRHVLVAKAE